ncbi:MAG: hypothetical protein LBI36_03390, partial [Oscillospiraceae bacterium]|nr:hypothetical protein [Oscillospiraceae bacterium]
LNRNVFSADFPSYRVNFSSNIADIIVKIALSDEKSTQKSTTIQFRKRSNDRRRFCVVGCPLRRYYDDSDAIAP